MLKLAFLASVLALIAAAAHPATAQTATPYPGPAKSIGSAANGCLAGAQPLPLSGSGWQIMKPSRNRFWGHPDLLGFLADMGERYRGTGTILIGDMSLARGGRMPTGHASHQTGIDADIMYRVNPPGVTFDDAEAVAQPSAVMQNAELDPAYWGPAQEKLLRQFAADSRVERIFVNPVIKRALCRQPGGHDWLAKLRPWWGHDDHLHVRLACPAGDRDCVPGPVIPPGDGCDEAESWIVSGAWKGRPPVPAHPAPPPPVPAACVVILGSR